VSFAFILPPFVRDFYHDHASGARAHELGGGDREHRVRRAGRRPDGVVAQQVLVDQLLDRPLVPERRDAADGESRGRPDERGVRLGDRGAEVRGDELLVHAVAAARDDEHRVAGVGASEDERLRDLLHLAAEPGGGLRRGARRLRQLHDARRRARLEQGAAYSIDGVGKALHL
jgi:hypothetical protein